MRDLAIACLVAISPIAGVVLTAIVSAPLHIGVTDLAGYPLFLACMAFTIGGTLLLAPWLEKRCPG